MSSEGILAGGPYKAATGHHEPLTAESLKSTRRMWALYCSQGEDYCKAFSELALSASRLIAKARLEEAKLDRSSVDAGILALRDALQEFYGLYIAGALVSRGEQVLVEVTSDVLLPDGRFLEAGSVTFLDAGTAAALYGLRAVRLVMTVSLARRGHRDNTDKASEGNT